MNSVCLQGRITKDLEKTLVGNQGHQKVRFSIAVDTQKKDQAGNKIADFFIVEAWDKQADTLINWTGKGKRVCINGRLAQDSWQGQDGRTQSMTYVVANQIDIIDFNEQQPQAPQGQYQGQYQQPQGQYQQQAPQGQYRQPQQPTGFNAKGQAMYNPTQLNQHAVNQTPPQQVPQMPNINCDDSDLPF